ncbi:outer membrane lipoprotein [Klebsiella pneumoniae subsp. ozaenae]|uniref:Outer membrane lipoprotein n=1 Tax=Klebsiella pneumoniae subsp. ozaenae TaxID=574 RepID=A0A377Z0J5_KLEPO|nr:outer membrane lipoprotein [Klebsiella pneumoniae subsp. ozaenae]
MRQSWLVNRSAIWVKYLASPASFESGSPPNIPTARKRLQINAARMKANAVLLHRCEVTSGTPGCYRQAVCLGSALNVSAQ